MSYEFHIINVHKKTSRNLIVIFGIWSIGIGQVKWNLLKTILFSVVENDLNCHIQAAHSEKHLVASSETDVSHTCGTKIQPWIIESPKGQRVKVTYVSIGSKKSRGSRVSHRCSAANQGIVIDKLGRRNVSVCEGSEGWSLEDDQQYYLSEGSVLQIILNQKGVGGNKSILKIQGIGLQYCQYIHLNMSHCLDVLVSFDHSFIHLFARVTFAFKCNSNTT